MSVRRLNNPTLSTEMGPWAASKMLYTYAALIKFQEAHGLPATGYFGPLTRAAINASTSPSN